MVTTQDIINKINNQEINLNSLILIIITILLVCLTVKILSVIEQLQKSSRNKEAKCFMKLFGHNDKIQSYFEKLDTYSSIYGDNKFAISASLEKQFKAEGEGTLDKKAIADLQQLVRVQEFLLRYYSNVAALVASKRLGEDIVNWLSLHGHYHHMGRVMLIEHSKVPSKKRKIDYLDSIYQNMKKIELDWHIYN